MNEEALLFLYAVRDIIIFSIVAIVCGFTIDYIYPQSNITDSVWITLFWLFFQIFIGGLVIYGLSRLYELVTGAKADQYFGLTFFVVLFFLIQIQLYNRLVKVYYTITGRKLHHLYG
jgi:hypothetical protein